MVVSLPNVASAAWSSELSISVVVACRVVEDVPYLSSMMQRYPDYKTMHICRDPVEDITNTSSDLPHLQHIHAFFAEILLPEQNSAPVIAGVGSAYLYAGPLNYAFLYALDPVAGCPPKVRRQRGARTIVLRNQSGE